MNKLIVIVLILLSLFVIFFQEKICSTLTLSPHITISTIKEGLNNKPYTFINDSHPKEYTNLDFNWNDVDDKKILDNILPESTKLTADYALFYHNIEGTTSLKIDGAGYNIYVILCGPGGDGGDGMDWTRIPTTKYNGEGGGGGGVHFFRIDGVHDQVNILSKIDETAYYGGYNVREIPGYIILSIQHTMWGAFSGGTKKLIHQPGVIKYNYDGNKSSSHAYYMTSDNVNVAYDGNFVGSSGSGNGGKSYHNTMLEDIINTESGGNGFFSKGVSKNGGSGFYVFDDPELGSISFGCGGGGEDEPPGKGGGKPNSTETSNQCGGNGGDSFSYYNGYDGKYGGGGGGGGGGNISNVTKGGKGGKGCVFIAFVRVPAPCVYPDEWTDENQCPSCGTADITKKQTKTATSKRCIGDQTLSQTVSCNLKPCCVYGEWTDDKDTPCPSCGTNVHKKQNRTATTKDCFGAQIETRDGVPCDIPECAPCVYNSWTDDDKHCPSCGVDISITQHRTATTKDCLNEQTQHRTTRCEIQACPPCDYSWTDVTPCTKPCNGGTKSIIGKLTNSYGQDCPTTQTKENVACNIEACPPCSYGSIDTSTLSACSLECGGGKQTGTLLITNKNGNDNCQPKTDSHPCNTQGCPGISQVIPYQYEEYWNLYLSNHYNSASNFTIAQSFSPQNSSFKDNFNRINSQNAEQYRNKLLVSTYALTIDMMSIALPYTTHYYFNNSQNGVLQITNGSTLVTTLQLNNNNNNFGQRSFASQQLNQENAKRSDDFGTVLNAIYINNNGVPRIYNSRMYFLEGDIDTTKYNIYLVTSKVPQIMKARQLLSCTVPGVGKQSSCMITTPGQNMAVAFTINLKSANNTSNKQQIIGITMDPGGDEQIVFGAWICPQSNALMIQRATINNPQNVISGCKVLLDVGLDNIIYVLFNGSNNLYEIYKNNVLVDTNISDDTPKYTSGKCYIFNSFKSYDVMNGTFSNVVYLASDYKTFATDDLDRAINYMNNNIDFSSMEKPLQEGFSNVYLPLPNGSYATQDLRNMESELVLELNNFNKQYSYYKKYMYNNRHNVSGDTTQPFLKDNNSPIGPADFPDLNINVPLNEITIYKNLLNDLNSFNHALSVSVNLSTNKGIDGDVAGMMKTQNDLVQMRQKLDANLFELNEVEGSMANDSMRSMYSTIFANILWTSIATSMVYLVFVHT